MNISGINLKVLILDTDYYALEAINSYLAWDRRTRVTCMAESEAAMWDYMAKTPLAELPDVALIDADHIGGPEGLTLAIRRLRERVNDLIVICLAQMADVPLVLAASESGARGYLLKGEVRSQIAWGIVFALEHDFVVTPGIARLNSQGFNSRVFHAAVLPHQREYPELTDRIRRSVAQAGGPAAPQPAAARTRTAESRPAVAGEAQAARHEAANDEQRPRERTRDEREAPTKGGREAGSAR